MKRSIFTIISRSLRPGSDWDATSTFTTFNDCTRRSITERRRQSSRSGPLDSEGRATTLFCPVFCLDNGEHLRNRGERNTIEFIGELTAGMTEECNFLRFGTERS